MFVPIANLLEEYEISEQRVEREPLDESPEIVPHPVEQAHAEEATLEDSAIEEHSVEETSIEETYAEVPASDPPVPVEVPIVEVPRMEDLPESSNSREALEERSSAKETSLVKEPIAPLSKDVGTKSVSAAAPFGGNAAKQKKLILKSRSKKERKRFSGTLKRNYGEAVKLAPTYKILPKREDHDEPVTFKTKNPRAIARIKKVMEQWERK